MESMTSNTITIELIRESHIFINLILIDQLLRISFIPMVRLRNDKLTNLNLGISNGTSTDSSITRSA
ncbi:unnamed protein product [Ambrosiozyma monospora]|uniref:Unnamed protein product n=1 Tax=Ambrosiozyma monospora TaxID=43982 RepID=A0ACB5UA75_AMBMO|nr:unnamed protein product [Ambrosiozyma monospora]